MNDMEKKYNIGLWCGSGYLLDTFAVSASCEEEALEILLSKLEKDNRTDLYLTGGKDYQIRKAGRGVVVEYRYK